MKVSVNIIPSALFISKTLIGSRWTQRLSVMQEIQLCKKSSLHLSDLEKALHQSIEVEGKCIKIPILGDWWRTLAQQNNPCKIDVTVGIKKQIKKKLDRMDPRVEISLSVTELWLSSSVRWETLQTDGTVVQDWILLYYYCAEHSKHVHLFS